MTQQQPQFQQVNEQAREYLYPNDQTVMVQQPTHFLATPEGHYFYSEHTQLSTFITAGWRAINYMGDVFGVSVQRQLEESSEQTGTDGDASVGEEESDGTDESSL